MDFQVGDRVRVCAGRNTGAYGTIIFIDDDPVLPIAVCHDHPVTMGHSCGERIQDGCGWYYCQEVLELTECPAVCRITSLADLI